MWALVIPPRGSWGIPSFRACNRKHEIFERLITRWPNHSATFPRESADGTVFTNTWIRTHLALLPCHGLHLCGFLLGTFVLALMSVIIGEFSISLIFRINRTFIDKQTDEIVRYQNLSIDALAAGDKEAYHASNKMANEAFGKSFFYADCHVLQPFYGRFSSFSPGCNPDSMTSSSGYSSPTIRWVYMRVCRAVCGRISHIQKDKVQNSVFSTINTILESYRKRSP